MPTPKIDRVKLSQLLKAGKTQREVAQVFGVSESAISKARKELNLSVVKNVALENAGRIVDKNLNAVDQLQKINEKANHMLDELTGDDRIINRMVKAVEGALTYEGNPKEQSAYIRNIVKQVSNDRFLALKAMTEIRGQLNLQLEIFQTLYDIKAVQEFQQEVLSAIGEASPEVRDAIIRRLNEKSALRRAIKFN